MTSLEQRFPLIAWRKPVAIIVGGETRYACRLCIATYGLRASDHERLAEAAEEVERHLAQFHPEVR